MSCMQFTLDSKLLGEEIAASPSGSQQQRHELRADRERCEQEAEPGQEGRHATHQDDAHHLHLLHRLYSVLISPNEGLARKFCAG